MQVWTGTLDALPADEMFDLVTMTHVLEHALDPIALLARARRALTPKGLLIVEVPNVLDPLIDVWGRYYRPLCLGDHVSFFSATSLRAAIKMARFEVLDETSPTHARDVVYASLLSAVDAVRELAPRAKAETEGRVGVETQLRYRGRLRQPLRRALDGLTRAIDPAVVLATRRWQQTARGACLIAAARPC